MIDYVESIEIVPVKELKEENNSFIEKNYLAPIISISGKKSKDRINKPVKNKIPLRKWIMPKQPEGYIKTARYDFF